MVFTIFLMFLNKTEFDLVAKQNNHCKCNHIALDLSWNKTSFSQRDAGSGASLCLFQTLIEYKFVYLFNVDENNYKHSKYNVLKIQLFINPVLS